MIKVELILPNEHASALRAVLPDVMAQVASVPEDDDDGFGRIPAQAHAALSLLRVQLDAGLARVDALLEQDRHEARLRRAAADRRRSP